MFSPISASKSIKDEFIGYISTLFHISDREYANQFVSALQEDGAIAKGPYLDVSDSYKTGSSLAQLIEQGEASVLFRGLEGDIPDGEKEIQIDPTGTASVCTERSCDRDRHVSHAALPLGFRYTAADRGARFPGR